MRIIDAALLLPGLCVHCAVKELHFFDNPKRFKDGTDFFKARFDAFANAGNRRILDCTPTYMGNMPSLKRIAGTFSGGEKVKVVVMLRCVTRGHAPVLWQSLGCRLARTCCQQSPASAPADVHAQLGQLRMHGLACEGRLQPAHVCLSARALDDGCVTAAPWQAWLRQNRQPHGPCSDDGACPVGSTPRAGLPAACVACAITRAVELN